jgi:hypothetical protein
VLVFGESPNDTAAIKELIEALCPELTGSVETRRQPQIHMKDVPLDRLPRKVDKILKQIQLEIVGREVSCIFIHEDCDDVEPADTAAARRIEDGFRDSGYRVHAVTPAWEIEAWWLQWPEQVGKIRSSWRSPTKYLGREVGRVRDAKEELDRLVTPPSARDGFLGYRESDSAAIARQVRDDNVARSPKANSSSYLRFIRDVDDCCPAAAS